MGEYNMIYSDMESTTSPPWITEDPSETDNSTTEPTFLYGDDNVFYFPTPEDMLNPSKRNPAFYPIVITHSITFVLGIIGNIVAVSVMVGDRKGRSATNLFLVSLAVADLLLLLLCIPLEVLQYFLQFEDNGVICKTARYTELLSASASVLNLCAVSLERFIVIVFPMRSRSVCTISNCRKAICCVWIIAVVLSLPVMLTKEGYSVTYTNNITSVKVYYCEEKSVSEGLPIAIYKFVILFAAPALLMMICYVYVIRELWRSTRNINLLTNSKSIRTTVNINLSAKVNTSMMSSSSDNLLGKPKVKSLGVGGGGGGSHNQLNSNNVSPVPSSSVRSSQRSNNRSGIGNGGGNGDNGKGSAGGGGGGVGTVMSKNLQNNGYHSVPQRDLLRAGSTNVQRRNFTQTRPNKGEDAKKARRQVIKMLILIIILFLVCWGPKLILNITLKLALIFGLPIYSPEVYYMRVIFSLVPFVHSCINPIVYSFMSKNFRRSMNRQLGRCCAACGCKCRNSCGLHRNSIPLRSTATTRTTQVESTYSSNYCQISDVTHTRHTEVEGVSAI